MPDLATAISMLEGADVVAQAKRHHSETSAYQAGLQIKYDKYHHYYQPEYDADQWPEDRRLRPGKVHITVNKIRGAVDTDARIQAILPRISLTAPDDTPEARTRAEIVEKLVLDMLDRSGWDVWLSDFTRAKCLYGKGILKPFWNSADKRPDVYVVEEPGNLRIGWGASDFRTKDWALYEYGLSPLEVQRRWPDSLMVEKSGKSWVVRMRNALTNAGDPLGMKSTAPQYTTQYAPSDYEAHQMKVWDYWYRDEKGTVRNAMIVEGLLAEGPTAHPELIDIPYIVVENDHEPGSPEGISDVEVLLDLQDEINRGYSEWGQLIVDNIDPAWQLTGDNATGIPEGLVPKGGEIVPAGPGNRIEPISKTINNLPLTQYIEALRDEYHDVSGLPRPMFGQSGAQTAGRALMVQIEAALHRLDPKRRHLYAGLRELIAFWSHMFTVKVRGPVPEVDAQRVTMKALFKDMNRWKIVAPEITPRDVIENTQNVANKLQAKMISLHTAMDEVGIDSPEDEIAMIVEERSNASLFPGDVQTKTAVILSLLQAMQSNPQLVQQVLGNSIATANDLSGQNFSQQQAQEAQPTMLTDQNAPMSQPGSPPAPGGPAPTPPAGAPLGAVTGTSLVRTTPQGGAVPLNQIATKYPIAGR